MNSADQPATPPHVPDPREAAEALERVSRLAGRTRAQGWRWVRLYLTGWAVASVGLVLAIGLGGRVGFFVGMGAWAVIVAVGTTWANRQGATAPGTARRIFAGAITWAVVYGVTIFVGTTLWPGLVAFWVPAALVSAVPLLLAAWRPVPRDVTVPA
ncbi:hypothetical protein [Cellulosimicrobium composti]|uniref:hypothetical protein n=1 Tax=Cellulosimicrobium composti TaxID=2672572 RepID=UPI00378AC163